MSDSYNAIYDAVSNRITGGNIGEAVADVVRERLDISQHAARALDAISRVEIEMLRPFYLLRPRMFPDGDMWCALYGEDLQSGVAGFGETPERAAIQFDIEWLNARLHQPMVSGVPVKEDVPRHRHVAGDGKDIDTCKQCGHDFRHECHFRVGESA